MNKDKKIKLGIVGLGGRGYSLIKTIFSSSALISRSYGSISVETSSENSSFPSIE